MKLRLEHGWEDMADSKCKRLFTQAAIKRIHKILAQAYDSEITHISTIYYINTKTVKLPKLRKKI